MMLQILQVADMRTAFEMDTTEIVDKGYYGTPLYCTYKYHAQSILISVDVIL